MGGGICCATCMYTYDGGLGQVFVHSFTMQVYAQMLYTCNMYCVYNIGKVTHLCPPSLSLFLCRGQYKYITKEAVVLDDKVSNWKYGISEIMNFGLIFSHSWAKLADSFQV